MSSLQAGYAFVALLSLILGIALFFIDGMFLWSLGFLILFMILAVLKVTWGISGWAERVTRNMGNE